MENENFVANALVGQSGGPTAAINATLSGVIRGALASDRIGTLYGMRNGIEGFLREDLVDLSAKMTSEKDLSLLEQTPAAALGSCRRKLPDPDSYDPVYDDIFALFSKYDIRYFFYIGGNDSMDTVNKINAYAAKHGYPLKAVGVPKTIDNDVCATDHTPGFGSAAKYIATTMQEILRDCAVYTVPAVTIVEIMGRDAGWLTCCAALPKRLCGVCPDLVYLPERPFSYEQYFADLRRAQARHPNVVVAVSEGIRFEDGTYVGSSEQSGVIDVFGHQYLSGTGKTLEHATKRELGCKVRSIELNLMQRCAAHVLSAVDIEESVRVGRTAVEMAMQGATGVMLGFARNEGDTYGIRIVANDLSKIANEIRAVPDAYINKEANHVTDDCLSYLEPLICGEIPLVWENGLPHHFTF